MDIRTNTVFNSLFNESIRTVVEIMPRPQMILGLKCWQGTWWSLPLSDFQVYLGTQHLAYFNVFSTNLHTTSQLYILFYHLFLLRTDIPEITIPYESRNLIIWETSRIQVRPSRYPELVSAKHRPGDESDLVRGAHCVQRVIKRSWNNERGFRYGFRVWVYRGG